MKLKEFYTNDFLDLKMGFMCNNACIHCFISKRGESFLSTNQIKSIINTTSKSGILFTGGEPTIRPDIIQIVKYTQSLGKKVFMQSNGRMFADPVFTKTISPYLDTVIIAFHDSNPSVFDKISAIKGSFEETYNGMHNLLENNVYMLTQTVITKLNYTNLLSTFDFIQNIGSIDKMTLTFPHPVGRAYSTNVVPTYTEIEPYLKPVLEKYSKQLFTHYIPLCYLYPYQDDIFVIDRNEVGNREELGVDYVSGQWKEIDYGNQLHAKIKSESCKTCIFNSQCPGIWREYGELYNFNIDVKPIH